MAETVEILHMPGLPLASLFTPVESGADALTRLLGLDPSTGAGAALAFFLFEFVKVSVLILVISWGMALVRRSLPMDRMRRWLATPSGRLFGYPAAAGFGAVTPFCSCSSVPLFIGFVEAGIPVGVTFAFLITSPLVNEIVVALFFATFGWKVAALYAGCGIALGIVGGMVMHALRSERWLSEFARGLRDTAHDASIPAPAPVSALSLPAGLAVFKLAPAGSADFDHLQPRTVSAVSGSGSGANVLTAGPSAVRFATEESWGIYRSILPYLAIALLVGAGMHGWLPDRFFASFFSTGAWWHVPAAVVIGLPLYASANATVPILLTLVAKGVPLGTGMALIMSAVGVSLPELVLLKRVMTVRLLAMFTLVVSIGVILVGFLFNTLPPGW